MFIILCPRQNCHLFNLLGFFSLEMETMVVFSPFAFPSTYCWCLQIVHRRVHLTVTLGLQIPIHAFAPEMNPSSGSDPIPSPVAPKLHPL